MIPNYIIQKSIDLTINKIFGAFNRKRKVVRAFGLTGNHMVMCIDIVNEVFMMATTQGFQEKHFSNLNDNEHRILNAVINYNAKSYIANCTIHIIFDNGDVEVYRPKYIGE
jgi:hypothetical protein